MFLESNRNNDEQNNIFPVRGFNVEILVVFYSAKSKLYSVKRQYYNIII